MRDCYDTCVLDTWIDDGKLVVMGNKDHYMTAGFLCPKGVRLPLWFHSEDRLKRPLVRKNGKLRETSWEEAIGLVAEKIEEHIRKGTEDRILLFQYAGDRGVVNYHFPMRLFHKIGATFLDYGVCDRAGQEALKRIYGSAVGMTPIEASKEKLVVYWGMNPVWTNVHGFNFLRKRGVELWSVDVRRTPTSDRSDRFFMIRPGSDFLFAIFVMKEMIDNGWYDESFAKSYIEDWKEFKGFIEKFPFEFFEYTGVSLDEIRIFAKEFYEKKGVIHLGYGFQRSVNGGYGVWFASLIPALVGKKCGFLYDMKVLRKEYAEGKFLRSVEERRIPQMLVADYMESGMVDMVYVYNANPLNSHQNTRRLRKALEKVFLVVHDIFLTETAEVADVVLPSNTFFERLDVADSYYHTSVILNEPVIRLWGKSNREVAVMISERLGFDDEHLYESEEEIIKRVLADSGIDYKELFERRVIEGRPLRNCRKRIRAMPESFDLEDLLGALKLEEGEFWIVTPTHYMTITSQYYNSFGKFEPRAYLNPLDAENVGVEDGEEVLIESDVGAVKVKVGIDEGVQRGVVVIYKGSWKSISGVNVNELVGDEVQRSFGNASIYHGYRVRLKKL